VLRVSTTCGTILRSSFMSHLYKYLTFIMYILNLMVHFLQDIVVVY
jgi:hypothetical protein